MNKVENRENNFYKLNIEDKENVLNFLKKHSLIEASAGTGKTYTIVKLVEYIISYNLALPDEILILTFTEKAAGELKDRIYKNFEEFLIKIKKKLREDNENKIQIEEQYKRVLNALININKFSINTIHSFCNQLIKNYYLHFNINPNFELVNDNDMINEAFYSFLRKGIFEIFDNDKKDRLKKLLDLFLFGSYSVIDGEKSKKIEIKFKTEENISNIIKYINKISYLYPYLIGDDRIKKYRETINNLNEEDLYNNDDKKFKDIKNSFINLISIYVLELAYKIKRKKNLISFNDMIHEVFFKLKDDENFKNTLSEKFKYGFIDEFQDTDPIQWEIFKKIFLNNDKENILVLIGDPKQSIYSFRNADIITYFEAKETIIKNGGYVSTLTNNYRSTKELINTYNILFKGENNDFFYNLSEENKRNDKTNNEYDEDQFDLKITYNDIEAKSNKYEIKVVDNNSDYKDYYGLYFVKIDGINNNNDGEKKLNSEERKRIFLNFIGRTILDLINGKYFLIKEKEKDNDFRAIKPNEIAILVSSRDDATYIQKYLFEIYRIDTNFYKKNLLFQSDEAINVLYLLEYLSDPSNINKLKRVLLTDYFYFEERENGEKIDLNKIISENKKIQFFLEEAKKNDVIETPWLSLSYFYKILNLEDNIFKVHKHNCLRILTNYRQICEKLEYIAYKEKLNLNMLKYRLISLIYKDKEESIEEDLFRIDSQLDKVNILTIHASKGLEFPVVFDFGALIEHRNNKSFYYRNKKNYYIDIESDFEDKIKILKLLEYTRLHYVAITRAKLLCYVPIFKSARTNKSLSYLINNLIFNSKDSKVNKDKINKIKNESIIYFSLGDKFNNRENVLNNSETKREDNLIFKNTDEDEVNFEELDPALYKQFNNRQIIIRSFSSLHKRSEIDYDDINEILKKIDDEKYNDDIEDDNKYILPKGIYTGLLVHSILENIDYQKRLDSINLLKNINIDFDKDKLNNFENKDLKTIISIFNFYYGKETNRIEIFNSLISLLENILNLNIPEIYISIKDIKRNNRLNEFEFLFKEDNCFINGFIDILFKNDLNDKYYILDWKTNCLGGINPKEHFNKTYYLQAYIYEQALIKYLSNFLYKDEDIKKIYEKYFGGIVFLYVREIGSSINNNGIVFLAPDFNRFLSFSEIIKNNIEHK